MSAEGLQALRERVLDDPELALRLFRVEPERFTNEVLRAAADVGCEVTEADIDGAISMAQRAWHLRWIS